MRRFLCLSALALISIVTCVKATQSPIAYPNELPHFEFYAKYLGLLRPYVSDHASVVRVLGSDQGIELNHWRIRPLFVGEGKDSTVRPEVVGRLASLNIRPKQRVSMLGVKFPATFTHSLGGVSEINVSCDVYSDRFGLQYWIYSEDWRAGKKGDLEEIVYGPSEEAEQQATGRP
jgi:hypothetical protein